MFAALQFEKPALLLTRRYVYMQSQTYIIKQEELNVSGCLDLMYYENLAALIIPASEMYFIWNLYF